MFFSLGLRFFWTSDSITSSHPPPTPFLSGFGTSHGELLLTLWRLCRILKGCRSIITSAVTPIVKLLLRPPYCYRPQTKFAKVMFLHRSVSHSVHREGACVGRGGMHGWGGVCMAGGMCGRGRGRAWQGGVHATHAPSPGHCEIRSVNARAVRILLECILVLHMIPNQPDDHLLHCSWAHV